MKRFLIRWRPRVSSRPVERAQRAVSYRTTFDRSAAFDDTEPWSGTLPHYTVTAIGFKVWAIVFAVGLLPIAAVVVASASGYGVARLVDEVGPGLLLCWPLVLAVGTKLLVRKIAAERNKVADEWKKPLLVERSRVASLEIVARARYETPSYRR
ncbi:hypothetical protein RCH10_002964 [Variovorax sp. GrIS 2.14]|uniref:hypothetical protein n=1 Tax=Variovorax sp. GrIS 2.14 TaxID=3071709 RepID=UPI0038F6F191